MKKRRNYKKEYKTFQGKPSQIKYRSLLNQEARKRKVYGKRGEKDLSHSSDGSLRLQHRSVNRSYNGHGKSRYSR